MLRVLLPQYDLKTFQAQQRRQFILAICGVMLFSLYVGKQMGSEPPAGTIGWLVFAAAIVAVFIEPRYGIYLTVFFSLAGDMLLNKWYPFNKNFSSSESIFFVATSLKFSALELYLAIIILAWTVRMFIRRKFEFKGGTLAVPIALFFAAVAYGLVYGLVKHGNFTIALWEARYMFYLPICYYMVTNLVTDRRHLNNIVWAIMLANLVQGLFGCWYYFFYPGGNHKGSDGIMEHSASIHLDALFIFIMALFLFNGSKGKRTIMILFAIPGFWAYLVNQRRASFVSFGVAILLLGLALYRQKRALFWKIAPPLAIFAVLFLGATWNNNGTLGLPARGIKSALGIGVSQRDSASNVYREIENINTNYTIHRVVLTGVGFGNKFYLIAPMPDISFFIWWEYITHNSIMWVWMQTGIFGFLAMLMMVGMSCAVGFRAYDRIPDGEYKAIGITMLLYIVMHFTYAYVDMSWETQSMVFVGTAMGMVGMLDAVMAKPVHRPAPRYRWLRPQPVEPCLPEEA